MTEPVHKLNFTPLSIEALQRSGAKHAFTGEVAEAWELYQAGLTTRIGRFVFQAMDLRAEFMSGIKVKRAVLDCLAHGQPAYLGPYATENNGTLNVLVTDEHIQGIGLWIPRTNHTIDTGRLPYQPLTIPGE